MQAKEKASCPAATGQDAESGRWHMLYQNRTCPVCGTSIHKAVAVVNCPKERGLVCMTHCYQPCRFLDSRTSTVYCSYPHKEKGKKKAVLCS